jgi:hypothetical protein
MAVDSDFPELSVIHTEFFHNIPRVIIEDSVGNEEYIPHR